MLDMKWKGWLAMAIAGCALWFFLIALTNVLIGRIPNDLAIFDFGSGVIIILCIVIPVIRRIIRKGRKEGATTVDNDMSNYINSIAGTPLDKEVKKLDWHKPKIK